jgi:hypothetical protein
MKNRFTALGLSILFVLLAHCCATTPEGTQQSHQPVLLPINGTIAQRKEMLEAKWNQSLMLESQSTDSSDVVTPTPPAEALTKKKVESPHSSFHQDKQRLELQWTNLIAAPAGHELLLTQLEKFIEKYPKEWYGVLLLARFFTYKGLNHDAAHILRNTQGKLGTTQASQAFLIYLTTKAQYSSPIQKKSAFFSSQKASGLNSEVPELLRSRLAQNPRPSDFCTDIQDPSSDFRERKELGYFHARCLQLSKQPQEALNVLSQIQKSRPPTAQESLLGSILAQELGDRAVAQGYWQRFCAESL